MTAIAIVAALALAALFNPKLRQQTLASPRTVTPNAIFAAVAAKLREANVVVEFPQRVGDH